MTTQALYRMFDRDGRLLYVGITLDVSQRFKEHRAGKSWWTEASTITLERHGTRQDVEAAEAAAIVNEQPLYNVQRRRRHQTESLKRLKRLDEIPKYWFTIIRDRSHQPRTSQLMQTTIQSARAAGLSEEDIEWAVNNPRCPFLRSDWSRERIAQAAREGMHLADITRSTGYTREHIRRILRAHGIEGDR
ncbi:GIY-YIG nuclease family protein [Actinocrispum wychmicini]|nr:GIY-YIG nuclease family protein [Actinocrispum wychmicini]